MGKLTEVTDRPDPQGTELGAVSPLLQWEILVNPCPWCGKTPSVCMPLETYEGGERTGGTWVWSIYCENADCAFQPKGRHVAIRKSQRFNLVRMKEKLNMLCIMWNVCDKYKPYEKLVISLKPYEDFINKQEGGL